MASVAFLLDFISGIARNRLIAFVILTTASLLPQTAISEGKKTVDFEQLRPDSRVSAQMLCALIVGITVQVIVADCNLPRKPVDAAIDRSIVAVEAFIIANSSQHPTQDTMTGLKQHMSDWYLESAKKLTPEMTCGGKGFDKWFRSATPEEIDAGTKTLLETPPKPGNVPCL